jgi:SAM-dependent methyltransferase
MIKPAFILKGALTFILPRRAYSRQSGGSHSARYCYSVFMRHLVRLNKTVGFRVPHTVAELGPGDSIGMGLCALLCGSERYIGLDVVPFADLSGNAAVLAELVDLFKARAPIPDDTEFPRVKPKLDDYAFPHDILSDEVLAETLSNERIAALHAQVMAGSGPQLGYVAPWDSAAHVETGSVDWIFSQAVLEHVDDLDGAYGAFAAWLKPDGVMSHQIDFKCHNMANVWNGHWAAPRWLWRIVRGKRPYLLNCEPLPAHLSRLQAHGFTVALIERAVQTDGLGRERLPELYQGLSDEDLTTAGAFIVARKA